MNDVAVLIVTYNSGGEISRCLRSIFEQRDHVNLEVVVVDNASGDDTVEIVRREFPEVRLVLPGKNLGFSAGVNEAARHANAKHLLLLNPDTEIVGHGIDRLVDFAEANPVYGVYGGRTLRADGSLEPSSCWGAPTLWSMALFATGLSTLAPRNALLDPESLGGWQRDSVREVGVITGCFLLISAENWQRLGGLDERYFMYGEDVDFAMRAKKAGLRPVICPNAALIHEVGKSSATTMHKMMLLYRGKAELARTHWHGLSRGLALCFLKMGVALRALLARRNPAGPEGRWIELWKRRDEWTGGYGGEFTPAENLHRSAPGAG